MRIVYIIGYRGTRVERFTKMVKEGTLHPLLYLGHIGISLDAQTIYGFRPASEAAQELTRRGIDVAEYLKGGNKISGAVHDDTAFFELAAEIAEDAGTDVYQIAIELTDSEYEQLTSEINRRLSERELHWYRLPLRDENGNPLPMETGVDNCATYPRTLGLPIPENTGTLKFYVKILKERGTLWKKSEGE